MAVGTLGTAAHKVVGLKQTLRALTKGSVQEAFIAADADADFIAPVKELCAKQKVTCTQVAEMQELGRLCGIRAGAAAAAILKS